MEKSFNYLKFCQDIPRSEICAFAPIMHNFIISLKPKTILEIGTHKGRSTHIILNAIEWLHNQDSNYDGKLYSMDIRDTSDAIGPKNTAFKYWNFIQADSSKYKWDKGEIDFLLIDGGHRYEEVLADYKNYEPLVKSGGYILMHDTTLCKGVKRVFEEEVKHPKIELNWQFGMGVIQKK